MLVSMPDEANSIDLIDLIQRIRRLLSALDDCAHAVSRDLTGLDPQASRNAQALRPLLVNVADRVLAAAEAIEASEQYRQLRAAQLSRKVPR